MHKFEFSLQSLLDICMAKEKQQKIQLSQAEAALAAREKELTDLSDEYARVRERYARELTRGMGAPTMEQYGRYFTDMNGSIRAARERVRAARQERDKVQKVLVETRKELKTYEKLRESQYQQYLEERKAEEDKAIADLVCYKAITP